ncbi:DUF6644 family protein [Novosphingobium sp. PP1Y]|uniref:DUF6644 family protein n=1 Tax=Novosphingobium sp. PP1Y TaxID=702113 RepID=UPI00031DAEE9|nr:DUF6644 family protein [Novosphingobium sp. PP1Y]
MFEQISQQIAQTAASAFVANHLWVTPFVQSIHILAIAALSGALLMINLRLLGLAAPCHAMAGAARRDGRVAIGAGFVLLLSGIVLIIGEPARELTNALFQIKMLLVAAITGAVILYIRKSDRSEEAWSGLSGKLLAAVLIGLWASIIFAGRWIAYV